MATIREKGQYQWHAQIRRKGFPRVTKTFTTKKDAEAWATVTEAEMIKGAYIHRTPSEKVTFSELIKRYKAEVTPAKKNWKSESEILDRIDAKLGDYSLVALTSEMIAKYRDELAARGKKFPIGKFAPLAASTVNHYLNAISVVIDTAIKEWGYALHANPVANVKRPAPSKGRDRRLLPGEEKRILRECRRYKNPVLEPLVRLALETAMRQGELFDLQWEEVDLARKTARLRDTKNGEDRTVPLSTAAIAILQGMKKIGNVAKLPRGPVFRANVAATRIAYVRAIERAKARYAAACLRSGIEADHRFLTDLTFHDLRHEATSRLFERDIFDVMEIASITGHKTLAMLKRYTHLRAEDLARKLG